MKSRAKGYTFKKAHVIVYHLDNDTTVIHMPVAKRSHFTFYVTFPPYGVVIVAITTTVAHTQVPPNSCYLLLG